MDLVNLALLCKRWHAVADAAAWENVDGMQSLLRLMPSNVWEEFEGEHTASSLHFTCELTKDDWAPVLAKSRYVRSLYMAYLHPDVQRDIASYPPSQTLFPALRELCIEESSERGSIDMDPDFADVLIPPTLSILRVSSYWRDMCDQVAFVVKCCKESVTEVYVKNWLYITQERDRKPDSERVTLLELLEALKMCPRISHVSLELRLDPDPELLQALSQCPALKVLELSFGDDVPQQEWVPGRLLKNAASRFPAMYDLRVYGGSFLDVLRIIEPDQQASHRKLKSIYVHAGHFDESQKLQSLTKYMKDWCDASTLGQVTIRRANIIREDRQEWPLLFDHINPLTMLSGLRDVLIGGLYGTRITDNDCATMARAWHDLESLSIGVTADYETGTGCTLQALSPFVCHCPHLQLLCLPLDAINIPEVPQPTTPFQQNESKSRILFRLDISYGAISDPHAVADFLRELFLHERVWLRYRRNVMSQGLVMEEESRRANLWTTVRKLAFPVPKR